MVCRGRHCSWRRSTVSPQIEESPKQMVRKHCSRNGVPAENNVGDVVRQGVASRVKKGHWRRSTDPRTTWKRTWTLLERHKAGTMSKNQSGELLELCDDGDNDETQTTGVKCERHSRLPQTTMDEKRVRETGENEGDNLVCFIQDLSKYLYRESV